MATQRPSLLDMAKISKTPLLNSEMVKGRKGGRVQGWKGSRLERVSCTSTVLVLLCWFLALSLHLSLQHV